MNDKKLTRAAVIVRRELLAGGDLRRDRRTGHYILGLTQGPIWERQVKPSTISQLSLVRCARQATYAKTPCDWYELAD